MALTTNIIDYWKLDESSGTRADSVGTNTLTNNGSATYPSALINLGAGFDGTTAQQAFQKSSSSGIGFSSTADRTFSFWLNGTAVDEAHGGVFGIWTTDHVTDAKNFLCRITTGGVIIFYLGDGASTTLGNVTGTTNVANSSWHFVVITYDHTDNKARVYVDGNSTPDGTSAALSPGAANALFCIGVADNNSPFNGKVDEFGIWSRVLSTSEMSQLYNGGAGLQYPFTASSGTVINRGLGLMGVGQ